MLTGNIIKGKKLFNFYVCALFNCFYLFCPLVNHLQF